MKVTKKDNFNTLRAIAENANRPDLVEFIDHEIELLEKKNATRSAKPTATQIENAEIASKIPTLLSIGVLYRLSEIKAMFPELTSASGTQRISAICSKLAEDGVLVRTVEKRVVYYSLAE